MRPIIIGGGIAGCAMAAALRRVPENSGSVILERRQPGAPEGMGFILLPNGLAALEELAPEIPWTSAGHWIERASLRASNGSILAEYALDPALCVSRVRFISLLRDAALADRRTQFLDGTSFAAIAREGEGSVGEGSVREGSVGTVGSVGAVGAVGADPLAQAVILEDGRSIAGDCFFGCDGARSRVRARLFPEAQLSDAAVHEIVSVADAPELARELGSTFRKYHDVRGGLAVGMLAEGPGRVVWFVQLDARLHRVGGASTDAFASFADSALADWPSEVLEAIACTDFAKSHLWQTRDLPPLAKLHQANVALLGDAAHACLPFTSQGANGALVDAALLGRLLRESNGPDKVAAAFARYTQIRRPHHCRLFHEGRRLRDAFLAPIGTEGPALPLVA